MDMRIAGALARQGMEKIAPVDGRCAAASDDDSGRDIGDAGRFFEVAARTQRQCQRGDDGVALASAACPASAAAASLRVGSISVAASISRELGVITVAPR
jgi:hypothetical protein